MGILLHGVGVHTPANTDLDRSAAMRAAGGIMARWTDESDGDDRTAHLRTAARSEFGRRGYESTTMRDIAAAARLSTGTVYRSFRSKDELLLSIMSTYSAKWTTAWDAVLSSDASPLEKLDALIWVNINLIGRFSDEFKIQLAWLRQSPPTSPNLDFSFRAQLRQIKTLLTGGLHKGDLHLNGASLDVRARCLFEAVMTTPNIVSSAGARTAHGLGRDTVLRGAAANARPSRRKSSIQ
jgi:AcrR family transcriptional regulator